MTHSTDALADLAEFLDSFNEVELERLVYRLPHAVQLHGALPSGATAAKRANDFVAALKRYGLIDADGMCPELVATLRQARPRKLGDISRIAESLRRPRSPERLATGAILGGGRYRIDSPLDGKENSGVWRATDLRTRAVVTIKVLQRNSGASHIANVPDQDLIARVIEPPRRENGVDYCVLEYVEGRSFAAEVASGRLSDPREVLRIVMEIGDGLKQLHAHGIRHNAVAPQNILVGRDGRPRLIDFDRASTREDSSLAIAIDEIREGDLYTAPEWAFGADPDVRVDVFGLAMTAVFALTRTELPQGFNRRGEADRRAYIERSLAVEPALARELARACALSPASRHADMHELCAAVRSATRPTATPSPPHAVRPAPPPSTPRLLSTPLPPSPPVRPSAPRRWVAGGLIASAWAISLAALHHFTRVEATPATLPDPLAACTTALAPSSTREIDVQSALDRAHNLERDGRTSEALVAYKIILDIYPDVARAQEGVHSLTLAVESSLVSWAERTTSKDQAPAKGPLSDARPQDKKTTDSLQSPTKSGRIQRRSVRGLDDSPLMTIPKKPSWHAPAEGRRDDRKQPDRTTSGINRAEEDAASAELDPDHGVETRYETKPPSDTCQGPSRACASSASPPDE